MREETRTRLAAHAREWRHAGLIDDRQQELLQRRWGPGSGGGLALLKGLAVFAAFTLAVSVISLIGTVLHAMAPLLAPMRVSNILCN